MKSKTSVISALCAAAAMLILILDAKTALAGARNGVELCIRTVIPSLFPFLVLSVLLIGNLPGERIPFLRPLGILCRVPPGGETILLTGLLGGYPVGAQCVAQAFHAGQLPKETALRLLGFCNNAGPAFLFGMLSPLFSSSRAIWCIWIIHILCALLTGILLPEGTTDTISKPKTTSLSFPEALGQGLRTMGSICGWVVVFRILIEFCDRWFLWLLPDLIRTLFVGTLELTNGCVILSDVPLEGTRFILCTLFLGLGGVCVGMQTASVTGTLGTGLYFPGKLVQASAGVFLAIMVQPLLFPPEQCAPVHMAPILFLTFLVIFLVVYLKNRKNSCSNLEILGV